MKITAKLFIDFCGMTGGGPSGRVFTDSEQFFMRVVELGFKDYWLRQSLYNPNEMHGLITITEPHDSVRLSRLIELIEKELHLTPLAINSVPHNLMPFHYSLRYDRTYSKRDFDQASLLMLYPKHIDFATLLRIEDDETWVAKADHNQKSKRSFGALYPSRCFGIAEPLKSALDAAKLAGLKFEEIKILPADKAIKPLWKISSTVRLPRCLLPFIPEPSLQAQWGEFVGGFETNGFNPMELEYLKDEIDPLGKFDVATTAEMTWFGPMRQIVVSQKFRKIMADLKIPGVDYVPVRIRV